jgi:hypothetical protein
MEPEDYLEPCETRNVTRVTGELVTLRVTVQGERIKPTNKFALIESGEGLQLRLTGNRELEVIMMYSWAKEQASYNAGLLEMGVGLNKAQRDELAASGYQVAELARKCRHNGDARGELEKKGEAGEKAPSKGNPLLAFMAEHKEKTKEGKTLVERPFVAMKSGCTRGDGCWWRH